MPESILIACFDFPPNEGIGGRRWAKFAKGLVRQGYTVHVIKADPVTNSKSGWSDVLELPNLHIHSLPRTYPAVLSRGPKSFLEKIQYRLALERLKRVEKGTLFDLAIGWERSFHDLANALIREFNITKIAATGAPFNLLYYTCKLKIQHPQVTVVCDFRDPYLNAVNYGMTTLSPQQRQEEQRKFNYIVQHADVVTCPNEYLLRDLELASTVENKAKFIALPHIIDFDDIPTASTEPESIAAQEVNIVYAGALYLGLEKYVEGLNAIIEDCIQKKRCAKFRFDFFTPDQRYKSLFKLHTCPVSFHNPIGKSVFHNVHNASAALVMLADQNKDFLTTKFFEYLALRKPLLFVGAEGQTSAFIEANHLGRIIRSSDDLVQAINDLNSGNFAFDQNFDLAPFSLDARTQLLLQMLG